MNEELTGVNEAVVDEIPEQVAAEQEDDVVSIAELLEESNNNAAVEETGEQQQEDAPKAEEGDADPKKTVEQAQQLVSERENNAFARRIAADREQQRKKYENSPEYLLGKEYAAMFGGDAEAARKAIQKQKAEKLAKDPTALAEYVIEQSGHPHVPESTPKTEEELQKQRALELISEIKGVLGDDDINDYTAIDPDFIRNCDIYGAQDAAMNVTRKLMKQNKTAAKLEQNRRLPQPIRPSGNAQPKAVDFTTMSQKDWEASEAKIQKALREGKRIKF